MNIREIMNAQQMSYIWIYFENCYNYVNLMGDFNYRENWDYLPEDISAFICSIL
jgi:hypothetical protein